MLALALENNSDKAATILQILQSAIVDVNVSMLFETWVGDMSDPLFDCIFDMIWYLRYCIETNNSHLLYKQHEGSWLEQYSTHRIVRFLHHHVIDDAEIEQEVRLWENYLGCFVYELNLSGNTNKVLDFHLQTVLRCCPNLIKLQLNKAGITDKSLQFITTTCQQLQYLEIADCQRVSVDAVMQLLQAKKELDVVF